MPVIAKQFFQQLGTTTTTTRYTVPALTTAILKSVDVFNNSTAAALIRIHVVTSGGSDSTTNALRYDLSVAAKTPHQWLGNVVLSAGDTIRIRSSVANATNFIANGVEIT